MPGLTYREALDWLVATGARGVKVGLERTQALLDELGDPHLGLTGALVAGTNGKGSVCAMADACARAAGLRSVMLTKPHLVSYRERIAVDGVPIDEPTFAALVEIVRPAAEAVEAGGAGAPTQFEVLTVLGILAARRAGADVVICEVGLGGRLDSTNVLDLGIAAVTSVALDHREFLGDTIPQIAAEKAGILKPGNAVVTSARGEALEIVRRRAAETGAAPVLVAGEDIGVEAEARGREGVAVRIAIGGERVSAVVPLPGLFQAENAAVAAGICHLLRPRHPALDGDAVARGLAATRWRARLQWVDGHPPLLVDGAHNPAAVRAVVPAIAELVAGRPTVALIGCMADKDVDQLLEALRALQAQPVFTQAGTTRAARAVDLARRWGPGARAIGSLPDALAAARLLAGDDGVVLVCGSLYLAGDVLQLLGHGAG